MHVELLLNSRGLGLFIVSASMCLLALTLFVELPRVMLALTAVLCLSRIRLFAVGSHDNIWLIFFRIQVLDEQSKPAQHHAMLNVSSVAGASAAAGDPLYVG